MAILMRCVKMILQTYYLCILLLCLCAAFVYCLVYTTTRVLSPELSSCLNQHLYSRAERNLSRSGFVMAIDYSDQLTGSGMNLFCLQCLANSMDSQLVVVEPFVVQSTFGVAVDFRNSAAETPWKRNAVRMSDIYDLDKWLAFSREKCYAPLVSWESLLEQAPRNIVVVQHSWGGAACSLEALSSYYSAFFLLYRFNVVRKVCFNFKMTRQLELWRYKHSIYGDLDPNSVTLLYHKWMGVSEKVDKFTVSISDSECNKEPINHPMFNELHASPSTSLLAQADLYTARYLGGVSNNNMYIAVMLRMEQILVGASRMKNKLPLISRCIKNIIKKWKYMKKATGLTHTFVTLDYGKYGSKGFTIHRYDVDLNVLEDELSGLLSVMEQGTFSEWEWKIRNVSETDNPGYIASLQQTIAGRARCLITAGAGSFLNHAYIIHKNLYNKTCHVQLKSNCRPYDSIVKFSFQPTKV